MMHFSENRLVFRNLADQVDPTKYTTRVAEANAEQQAAQHQAQLAANQSSGQSANTPGFKPVAPVQQVGGLLDVAQKVYSREPGQTTVYNAGKPGEIGVAANIQEGNIARNAYNRLLESGLDPDQAAAKMNDPSYLKSIQDATTGAGSAVIEKGQLGNLPAGYSDTSKREWRPESGMSREAFEAQTASIEQRNTELLKQKQIQQETERNKITASKEAGVQTEAPTSTVTTPGAAGAAAAFANLPPEAQFLAPFLQEFQNSIQQSITGNEAVMKGLTDKNTAMFDAVDTQLSDMRDGYKATATAIQDLLKDAKDTNDKYLAEQKQSQMEQLAWDEGQQRRSIAKQKTAAHDSMVAQIALDGGFAQDTGLKEVAESDATFDSRMSELQVAFSFKRTDLQAKFTGMYLENQNNYTSGTITNMKDLQAGLERIGLQGISSMQARQAAEQELTLKAWDVQTNLRTTLASKNLENAFAIQTVIKEHKQELIDKEDRALSQISTLLKNFPEAEVRDIVLGLGKDVTSFSVEKMLGAKSNDEIEAARKAAAAAQQASQLAFWQKSKNAPLVTYDEFIKQKIAEKEQALGQTMNEKLRSEFLASNEGYFASQYDQFSDPGFENLTSGNPNIDAATDAFIRGDFTSIKEAAKTYGVNASDVSTYAGMLREQGASVGDIRALQTEQAKELSVLRKAIDDNDVTKKLGVMDSAIPKIGVARASLTGVGDVALLNFYQNGIVDPGLAVRKEDADILRKASAIKDKITTEFAESIIMKGAFFPDETRGEMERIAKAVYEATERVYQEKVFAPIVEQGELSGIGNAYFNYKKRKPQAVTTSADSYISSFGR